MREHILKTLPDYWDAVAAKEKTFEVRRDDRGFQKGDVLVLRRLTKKYDGTWAEDRQNGCHRDLCRRVAYILTGGQFGIEPGYVVMALR
jgi:Domain of unknown function (DUF3850)